MQAWRGAAGPHGGWPNASIAPAGLAGILLAVSPGARRTSPRLPDVGLIALACVWTAAAAILAGLTTKGRAGAT